MAYWLTKHWPLRKGDEKQSQAGVYVRPEDENIIKQVQPRDLVFIYETKGGKAELRKMADGTEELFPCRKGQGGIVALLEVTAKAFVREGSVPEKYSDGSTTWWKWFAPTKPVNTIGFVPREEVVRNLKYSPRYAFRGFGKNNSGLGRLTEEQFEALLFAFTSETGNNDEKTVQDNVAFGSDHVTINGNRRHVIGYLQDFLFAPARARSPVKVLSGGERNRLLLARIFTKPSNVLVLDEPTNDLDIETLDLLEELLLDYPGTVLLVSHDRAFINNVVTSTLVLEGGGRVNEYVGGYDDWLRQSRNKREAAAAPARTGEKKAAEPVAQKEKPRKLTFKEQKELDALPKRIEELDAEQQKITAAMADPAFYRESGKKVAETKARLQAVEKELAAVYKRWEELEALKG